MNSHKYLRLILAVVLLPVVLLSPGKAASICLKAEVVSPGFKQGIPEASTEWWQAVQEDFYPQKYQTIGEPAGVKSLPFEPDWIGESTYPEAQYGFSVDTAGDVNGDGYDDVIVGAPFYTNGEVEEGAAAVYYGGASGLALEPSWWKEIDQECAEFGFSVGTAGDVNGDGFDDIIIGAHRYDVADGWEGLAVVYYGSANGLGSVPGWWEEGDQMGAYFGHSVGTAGDVNGDGFDDVIVSAVNYSNGQPAEGVAAVYHGSASGLSLVPNWWDEGDQEYAAFGASVDTAGDVNEDGYDDVIVGAPLYNLGQENEGAAAVYYGSGSGLALTPSWWAESNQANAQLGNSVGPAGDVNGDGYDEVIVGADYYTHGQTEEGVAAVYQGSASGLSPTYSWLGESNQANAHYGNSVGTAGDVNRDGYDDIIVGAYEFTNGELGEGLAAVYLGSVNGLALVPEWMVEGNQYGAILGRSVGAAGDVNGDGVADIIVGIAHYSNMKNGEGRANVYHGHADYSYSYLPVIVKGP